MATLPATAANNPRGRGSVQALIPGRGVRALVTAVPIVVPVGMRALFPSWPAGWGHAGAT